jgi:hypothetical protein
MGARAGAMITALMAIGCPSSEPQAPMCDAKNACPSGYACDSGSCKPDICYGNAPLRVCLYRAQDTPIDVERISTLNTDTGTSTNDGPQCLSDAVVVDPTYCVIAGTTIKIGTKLRAIGRRPLVLLATDRIQISAIIDVGSHRQQGDQPEQIGAGADPLADCDVGTAPSFVNNSGGGGAGGSFAGSGGTGGSSGGALGGEPGASVTTKSIRGGCQGQSGAGMMGGAGGHGGGAVWLIATNCIDLEAQIIAGGEGGGGGAGMSTNSGGGGGGAGGMIGLSAPTVTFAAPLLANGGGGGEGNGNAEGAPGNDADGSMATNAASGGSGNSGNGGDGGSGSVQAGASGGSGANTVGGGGGGGGGAGGILSMQGAPGSCLPIAAADPAGRQ